MSREQRSVPWGPRGDNAKIWHKEKDQLTPRWRWVLWKTLSEQAGDPHGRPANEPLPQDRIPMAKADGLVAQQVHDLQTQVADLTEATSKLGVFQQKLIAALLLTSERAFAEEEGLSREEVQKQKALAFKELRRILSS